MTSVIHFLGGYEKKGDNLEIEIALKGISLKKLQEIFNRPNDDSMYDCYPVSYKEKTILELYAEETIDLEKYDFFLECYAKE